MNLILHQIKSSKLNFLEGNSGEYTPPAQIVLLPKSPIVGRDGRTFHYNTQEVLDSFIENQAKLPIDIEHATEINAPKGIYSPALGWVVSLQAGLDGEIIANIEWNSVYELNNKSIKYYSPAFEVDEDNKIIRLTSVGLTNRPNFKVPELNSRQTNSINSINKGGNKLKKRLTRVMNSKKARNEEEITEDQLIEEAKEVLDLPEDASLDQVIEEIATIVDENEELKKDEEVSTSTNAEVDIPASILSALGLAEGSSLADVIEVIKNLKGGDEGGSEKNSKTTRAMQAQIRNLTNIINNNAAKELKEKRERVLNSAINNGKVSPATRKALEISLNSVEAVEVFEVEMENAPSVFAKSITKPKGYSGDSIALNSEQKECCKKKGIKEKDYITLQNRTFNRE